MNSPNNQPLSPSKSLLILDSVSKKGPALDQMHGKAQENIFKFYKSNQAIIDKAIAEKAKRQTEIVLEDAIKLAQSRYILDLHFLAFQLLLLKQARKALKETLTAKGSSTFQHGQIMQIFSTLADSTRIGAEHHLAQFEVLTEMLGESDYDHQHIIGFVVGMLQNYLKNYKDVVNSIYKKEVKLTTQLPLWIQKLIERLEAFLEMLSQLTSSSVKKLPAPDNSDALTLLPEHIERESCRRAYHALLGLDKSLQIIVKTYSISPNVNLLDLLRELNMVKIINDATVSDVQSRS